MKKKLQPIEELAQKFHNLIPKINPQVFETVANLQSKMLTIDPMLLASIQRMAEQNKPIIELAQKFHNSILKINPQVFEIITNLHSKLSAIDPVMLSILQNDSFKSFVENINSTQLDGLSINDEDFENLINQIQIDDNTEAVEKQITQNPILLTLFLALLIAFFEQTGSNISDIFVKPQFEKLQDSFENNMDETRVITDIVNLREAPKGTAKSLLKLEANQTIKVLSKNGNWFKIRYFYDTEEYIEGWVFKKYTKKIDAVELK